MFTKEKTPIRSLIGVIAMLLLSLPAMAGNGPSLSMDIKRIMSGQTSGLFHAKGLGQKVCAFVRLRHASGEDLLARQQCEVVARVGDILIVNIPVDALPILSESELIDRIETQLGGVVMNDVTRQWVNSTPLYEGQAPLSQAYDGEGVLLGIVDGGFDISHPTFLSVDGSHTRIVGFLDQFAPDDETIGQTIPLGREYLTPDDIAAKQHSADVSGTHGTHCLGIAAGSGFGTPYAGAAYGADIYAVASKGVPLSLCSANEVALMKHIFDYADSLQRPCVITYSVGFDYIDTDAELFREAFGLLTGPGRIIVVAAGNSNTYATYVMKPASQAHAGSTLLLQDGRGKVYLRSEGNFRLKCISSKLDIISYVKDDSLVYDTNDLPDHPVDLGPYHMSLSKEGTFYTFSVSSNSESNNRVMMLIENKEDEPCFVEMYTCLNNHFTADFSFDGRFESAEHSHSITMPACLPNMVSIGALNCREYFVNMKGDTIAGHGIRTPKGTLAVFSSVGPTFDGLTKPDAVTPGVNVISSGNSFCTTDRSVSFVSTTSYNDREYPWMALSGTSMACPAAAGIIALWLQANPNLTPDDVKATFAATCMPPEADLEYPNNSYGYGLIDAYAGMLHVLGIDSSIPGVSTHQPALLHIRPNGNGAIHMQLDAAPRHPFTVRVYTVSGECVANRQFERGALDYYLPFSLPHAVYVIQVDSDEPGLKGSQLLRF